MDDNFFFSAFIQFNKDGDKLIEELKLRVVYKALGSENSPTDSMAKNSKKGSDSASVRF